MTSYRIEFGPAWPVPPIAVDFSDRNVAARAVAAHAIPHLTPVLAEKGRPELADCFFQTDRELTVGQFMWLDLAGERAAQFCPARLTPVPATGSCPCGSCARPCREQPATCPEHGAACEPDDHCEPPTVNGEVL